MSSNPYFGNNVRKGKPVRGVVLMVNDCCTSRELAPILSDKPVLAWPALPDPAPGLLRSALYIRVE